MSVLAGSENNKASISRCTELLRGATVRTVNSSKEDHVVNIRFPEDVIPLSDRKTNSGKVTRHVSEAQRPVLFTSQGRVVVQDEKAEEACSFMRGVVKSMTELDQGHETSLAEVKKRLGLT